MLGFSTGGSFEGCCGCIWKGRDELRFQVRLRRGPLNLLLGKGLRAWVWTNGVRTKSSQLMGRAEK